MQYIVFFPGTLVGAYDGSSDAFVGSGDGCAVGAVSGAPVVGSSDAFVGSGDGCAVRAVSGAPVVGLDVGLGAV